MAGNSDKDDFELVRQMHTVLAMHFLEGIKQSEIAEMLNMSTAKVNRLIKHGRERGMVHITIESPFQRLFELEKELAVRGGLEAALVTPTVSGSMETTLQQVGSAAALMLLEKLKDGDTIAVSGGKAVSALIENLKPDRKFDVQVVPLTGGVQGKHYTDVNHVATRLADRLGGQALLIHAPLFADTPEEKDALVAMRAISSVLDRARNADVALVGIGSILTPQSSYYDLHPMSAAERKRLIAAGAAGEFLAHLINDKGKLCDLDLNRRLVALGPDDLTQIPRSIGIASGEQKVVPIRSALNGGLLRSLVIDEATAKSVLDEADTRVK